MNLTEGDSMQKLKILKIIDFSFLIISAIFWAYRGLFPKYCPELDKLAFLGIVPPFVTMLLDRVFKLYTPFKEHIIENIARILLFTIPALTLIRF